MRSTRKVLVVLSGVERLPGAPAATGNYLREVALPVKALREAGFTVDFLTPDGRPALVRGNTAYGLADDAARDPALAAFVAADLVDERIPAPLSPEAPDGARAADYAAVFYAGSLGMLLDVAEDPAVAALAREIYDGGGIVAASGHGIAGLLALRTDEGKPWLAGRRVACFTREEDQGFFVERLGWKDVLPYAVEERIRAAGAVVDSGEKYKVRIVEDGEDGRLLTGQNAGSVAALTEALLARLASRAEP